MNQLHILQNEHLQATIQTLGAEMQTLTDRKSGRELMWHGDAAFWSGRAPILFPIVGGMWNGVCRINEQEYRIPKHGFVKDREWFLLHKSETTATFAVENTSEELEMFPWPYRLEVTYQLEERTLRTTMRVRNLSKASTMWFQIGGHPSIAMPDWQAEGQKVQGYLRLEGRPISMLRASTQGCTEAQRVAIPWNNDAETSAALARHQPFNALIPICVDTFANEALIFDASQISAIQVLDLQKRRIARVASSSPAWLVWSPQGQHAPFICCEPWYGLCDPQEFSGTIEERPHIQHLAPGHEWAGWYTVEV